MLAIRLFPILIFLITLSDCTSVYYDTMEKVGIHKRDILVDRVESARDAQSDAQEQFQSALDQFASVVQLEESNLKRAYDSLNDEYEACESSASSVSNRIEKVESVAEDLFKEWRAELDLYQNQSTEDLKCKTAEPDPPTLQRDVEQHEAGGKDHATGAQHPA